MKNAIVRYIRDDYGILAAVVATSPEKIGISICNDDDRFKKKIARELALGRAEIGIKTDIPNRDALFLNPNSYCIKDGYVDYKFFKFKLSVLIKLEVEEMKKRATRYFKKKEENATAASGS